jgi:hypothetical protein
MTEPNWRVAPSLDQLLLEVNTGAPNRSKASDGAHASPAHTAANPDSDHEAWYQADGMHWVTARDFTHDPAGGFDGQLFVNALVYMKDPRVKYIIHNRLIYNPDVGNWKPRPYNGTNPHTKHVHVSVKANPFSLEPYAWLLPGLFESDDDMALTPSDVWGFPVHNNYTGDDPDDVMSAGVALEWAMARASQAKETAEVVQSTVQRIEAQVAANAADLNRKLAQLAEHFGVYL